MDRLSTKFAVPLVLWLAVAVPLRTACQTTEPGQVPTVGLPTDAPPDSRAPQSTTTADRAVSLKLLVPNIVNDQKRIWLFPAKVAKGHDWIPTAAIVGTTAGLIALDPIEGSYFRRTTSFHGFNKVFTGNNAVIATVAVPASLYLAGLLRKDSKMTRTALLGGEAVADAEIVGSVLKAATWRVSPAGIPAGKNYSDSWFESGGSPLRTHGGFPSGHTVAAFSIATVVARRYGNHRWVPYAAYGTAALIGFSRITLSDHFTSDVFIGAVLGYSISRFAVLRQ